jgi:hypothetical protein
MRLYTILAVILFSLLFISVKPNIEGMRTHLHPEEIMTGTDTGYQGYDTEQPADEYADYGSDDIIGPVDLDDETDPWMKNHGIKEPIKKAVADDPWAKRTWQRPDATVEEDTKPTNAANKSSNTVKPVKPVIPAEEVPKQKDEKAEKAKQTHSSPVDGSTHSCNDFKPDGCPDFTNCPNHGCVRPTEPDGNCDEDTVEKDGKKYKKCYWKCTDIDTCMYNQCCAESFPPEFIEVK